MQLSRLPCWEGSIPRPKPVLVSDTINGRLLCHMRLPSTASSYCIHLAWGELFCCLRKASGVVLCHRLKARWKAPGSENPSRKATSPTESVLSDRSISAVCLSVSSRKVSKDVPSSESRRCNVRAHCKTSSGRFNAHSAASARGCSQQTPNLHGDTLLSRLTFQDLRRFMLEPVPKHRVTAPQRQPPGFTGQCKS